MSCTTAPPPDLEYRQFVTSRLVTIWGCLALLIVPFFWNSVVPDGAVLCPSRGVLGIPCPGCGLTRAFCALARGAVWQAVGFNALSLPLLVLFVAAPLTSLYELSLGRRCRWYRFLYSRRVGLWFAAALALYHLSRMGFWLTDGTLVNEYLKSGWLWRLLTG